METQKIEPNLKASRKSSFFTTISARNEADKPIRSIYRLFNFLGIVNLIAVPVMLYVYSQIIPAGTKWQLILNFLFGIAFIYFSRDLKKRRAHSAAIGLVISSVIAFAMAIYGLISTEPGLNIITIILYSIAMFSGIDALLIVKQLEKLDIKEISYHSNTLFNQES
jgi:hypothetical protein